MPKFFWEQAPVHLQMSRVSVLLLDSPILDMTQKADNRLCMVEFGNWLSGFFCQICVGFKAAFALQSYLIRRYFRLVLAKPNTNAVMIAVISCSLFAKCHQ